MSYRNFKTFSKRDFNEDLNKVNFIFIYYMKYINCKVPALNKHISDKFSKHAPKKDHLG